VRVGKEGRVKGSRRMEGSGVKGRKWSEGREGRKE
jgi:hypothetical protein